MLVLSLAEVGDCRGGGATEDEGCLLTSLEEEGGNFVCMGSTFTTLCLNGLRSLSS